MNKLLSIVMIVMCLSLVIPVSFAAKADKSSQDSDTRMLHAEHVFDANVTIGGLLDFGLRLLQTADMHGLIMPFSWAP